MKKVFVNEPVLDGNEKKYLNECIDTNWISFEGPFVKKFEEGMAELTNRKYGVAVSNGSVAIDTAVMALKLGDGDEVIMPTFTIMSCAAPIAKKGAAGAPALRNYKILIYGIQEELPYVPQ